VIGWIQTQAHDVSHLPDQQRIRRQFERVRTVRL
jgi:hypothetical protein